MRLDQRSDSKQLTESEHEVAEATAKLYFKHEYFKQE